jgi:hypothetical protein
LPRRAVSNCQKIAIKKSNVLKVILFYFSPIESFPVEEVICAASTPPILHRQSINFFGNRILSRQQIEGNKKTGAKKRSARTCGHLLRFPIAGIFCADAAGDGRSSILIEAMRSLRNMRRQCSRNQEPIEADEPKPRRRAPTKRGNLASKDDGSLRP